MLDRGLVVLDALLWGVNSYNLQRGQGLSMPLLATITFASPMLEDNDFFAPLLRRNLGFDPHASNGRRANRHLCALPDKLHIGQCDCVANGTREFFYINRVAWTHSILPTTRRHNRIHILSFSPQEQLYLILRRAVVGGTVSDQALATLYKKWVVNVPHAGEDCQARTASRHISLLHLAHTPHSVYSNPCGMDHQLPHLMT